MCSPVCVMSISRLALARVLACLWVLLCARACARVCMCECACVGVCSPDIFPGDVALSEILCCHRLFHAQEHLQSHIPRAPETHQIDCVYVCARVCACVLVHLRTCNHTCHARQKLTGSYAMPVREQSTGSGLVMLACRLLGLGDKLPPLSRGACAKGAPAKQCCVSCVPQVLCHHCPASCVLCPVPPPQFLSVNPPSSPVSPPLQLLYPPP